MADSTAFFYYPQKLLQKGLFKNFYKKAEMSLRKFIKKVLIKLFD